MPEREARLARVSEPHLLCELLGARLEVLLLFELALEQLANTLLLLRLLRCERGTQLHQVDAAVHAARRQDRAALLHAHRLQPVVVDLQRERGLVHLRPTTAPDGGRGGEGGHARGRRTTAVQRSAQAARAEARSG